MDQVETGWLATCIEYRGGERIIGLVLLFVESFSSLSFVRIFFPSVLVSYGLFLEFWQGVAYDE